MDFTSLEELEKRAVAESTEFRALMTLRDGLERHTENVWMEYQKEMTDLVDEFNVPLKNFDVPELIEFGAGVFADIRAAHAEYRKQLVDAHAKLVNSEMYRKAREKKIEAERAYFQRRSVEYEKKYFELVKKSRRLSENSVEE